MMNRKMQKINSESRTITRARILNLLSRNTYAGLSELRFVFEREFEQRMAA